jgi:hypothetical protein
VLDTVRRTRRHPGDTGVETRHNRKNRSKRTFATADFIVPTEWEKTVIINGLTAYYKNNPQFLKNGKTIEEKIEEVMEACKKGWDCAPKNFIKRVEWKTKWNCTAVQQRFDYKENYSNAKQIQLQKDLKTATKNKNLYPGGSGTDMRKMLTIPEEKKFWIEREEYYRDEFDFNNSSDYPLLLQLLLEELTQWRLARRRIINPDDEVEFLITQSYKRLIDAQKALGITREQREGSNKETEGNIAQLAKLYEEKKEYIEKIKERDRLDEELKMQMHLNKKGLDYLPSDLADAMRNVNDTEEIIEMDIVPAESEEISEEISNDNS